MLEPLKDGFGNTIGYETRSVAVLKRVLPLALLMILARGVKNIFKGKNAER